MPARNVLRRPQVDFNGFVRIVCPKTGYHALVRFPRPKTKGERFGVNAKVFSVEKGHLPIHSISGKWNSEMKIERAGSEVTFYNPQEARPEPKVTYAVERQSFYESRRLWSN